MLPVRPCIAFIDIPESQNAGSVFEVDAKKRMNQTFITPGSQTLRHSQSLLTVLLYNWTINQTRSFNENYSSPHSVPCPRDYHWDGKSYVQAAGMPDLIDQCTIFVLQSQPTNPRLRVLEVQGDKEEQTFCPSWPPSSYSRRLHREKIQAFRRDGVTTDLLHLQEFSTRPQYTAVEQEGQPRDLKQQDCKVG
ncbi:hypothetical protein P5673_020087 [Acropora cervicornis]|uniref:Uncharacterized protein n=1 Tax=Acropora cervicornis TaxID=6130 RepID=A0AAD9QAI2_ACRCE|nr:hypothetical protein P5673_020087 [Acropora cervicornis]